MKLRHRFYAAFIALFTAIFYFKTMPEEIIHSDISIIFLILFATCFELTFWSVLGYIKFRHDEPVEYQIFVFIQVINYFTMGLVVLAIMIVLFILTAYLTGTYLIGYLVIFGIFLGATVVLSILLRRLEWVRKEYFDK